MNGRNPVIPTDATEGHFADLPGAREAAEPQIPLRRWGVPDLAG
ncbi:hypothetical protein [Frankia sp. AiPs1]|nr:hypothetical protein [Frankia sp. AiPs1]